MTNNSGGWMVPGMCILGGFLLGLLLFGGQRGPEGADPAAEAQVRALLDAQVEAWNRGDLEGFLTGYWDDEGLRFYSGDAVTRGLEEVRQRYRKRYKAEGKEMGRLTFSDVEARGLGGGWATARGRWKVVRGKETLEGLFTLVLRRTAKGWKVVQDHTSAKEKGS